MSNARGCLEAIKRCGITKFWTGHAFVWDVATLDNDSNSGSLTFANEQDANAYVAALRAVVVAQRAAIILPRDVQQALDDHQCQRFYDQKSMRNQPQPIDSGGQFDQPRTFARCPAPLS